LSNIAYLKADKPTGQMHKGFYDFFHYLDKFALDEKEPNQAI